MPVKKKTSLYRDYFKPVFDFCLAASALVLLSPILLIIAFLVRWKLGSPVLFSQERPGLGGRPFVIHKFRTMTKAADRRGRLLPDAERLPPLGRFLRAASLDELPELWNVVRGNMSLVGPRPLLIKYLELYTPEQFRRHEVKPRLTGWSQVKGRNLLSWEERFNLDVWYVDNQSPWLDLKIMALTLIAVLKREGINHPGEATMPEFKGKTGEPEV